MIKNQPTWAELSARFKKLAEVTGFNKTWSYNIHIAFHASSGSVEVNMQTYECGDMPRWTTFEASTEEEAKAKTLEVIKKCEKEVEEWAMEQESDD